MNDLADRPDGQKSERRKREEQKEMRNGIAVAVVGGWWCGARVNFPPR